MELDEALVATTNRLNIGKGNQRLSPDLISNEATIQVVLDALKLTPVYNAFLVTAKSKAYREYYAFAYRAVPLKAKTSYKKKAKEPVSSKTTFESASKGPRLKTQAKMKQPAKKKKSKGLTMLTEAALSEADQLKPATKRSKKYFHISHASGLGDGVGKLSKGFPMESWGDSEEEGNDDDDDGNNDDEGGNDDESDDEQRECENDDESNNDDESTDNEDDEEIKELYDDVNINLGNTNAEMTDADQGTTKQQVYQEEEGAHVTLTHVHDATKADEPLQSFFVSSDFTSKGHDDKYKDQEPSAGSDRGMKRRRTEELCHNVEDTSKHQDQEHVIGETNKQLDDREATKADWFKKPERPPTPNFDWTKRRQIDFQPPQTWINLEYLKGGDSSRSYSTSVTKTKAASYDLKLIEDMGPKRQSFYSYASNLTSSKDVYSRRRIIAVTRLKIKRKYDYGCLEGIKVRQDDQQIYTFKEGDFSRLRLQDIEDMLLLLTQRRLTNLTSKRNRLMRTNELHKFSDGRLNDVHTALHDIDARLRMEYLPMQKWNLIGKTSAAKKDHMIYHMPFSSLREISSARKEHMPYLRFTKVIINHFISKDNTISIRNKINLHTIRDDTLLGTLKFISKIKDYQKYGALIPDGMINQDIKDSKAYKTYLDYAIGKVLPKKKRKFNKPASLKRKTVLASPKEPMLKGKQVKRPAKKATTAPTTSVIIRYTPGKSVSKKKALAKSGRCKGIKLLSDAAILEEAQLKKTMRKRKRETHKLQASSSSEGADFESEGDSKDESDDVHDEDDNDDDDGNDDDSGNDDDDSNDAEDSEQTDSDDDKNPSFTLKDCEKEEQDEEYMHTPKKDKFEDEEKMYEEEDNDVAKELYGDLNITQGIKDTDMTNAEQGGEDQQNSSYESRFVQEEKDAHVTLTTVHDKTEGIVNNYLASKLKEEVNVAVQLQSNKLKEEAEAENQEFFNQEDSTMKAIIKDHVKAQVSRIMPQLENKSTQAEEPEFEATDTKMQHDQGNESGHIDDQPNNEAAPKHDWFQKPNKPLNPYQGRKYPFDLSKPLPLIEDRGRQVVLADYFINNDLEYQKGGSSSSKYVTSTTRTKAAKYDNIEGIEDMVLTLWSLVKVAYNKHAIWGTYQWGGKRQRFYAYACHWKSLHDVYSKRRIIAEGDFPRLNLRDIKHIILLLVQKKLSNLDVNDRYDLGMTLRMFTKRIVILHRVKDLQLSVLNDIASNLEIDYLPKRHCSNLVMKRSHIMVKAIDKLLLERRLMRNLEKFVGGREYGNDLRLLE
nr:hypothetical protein [Tanacetum cinerariifolium]